MSAPKDIWFDDAELENWFEGRKEAAKLAQGA
jgi:hypothetical protein